MGHRTEKEYGERKVSPRNGEYGTIAVPKQALQDDDFEVERGEKISVKGIKTVDGETYLKIGGK